MQVFLIIRTITNGSTKTTTFYKNHYTLIPKNKQTKNTYICEDVCQATACLAGTDAPLVINLGVQR